jgi:hypothetical protein
MSASFLFQSDAQGAVPFSAQNPARTPLARSFSGEAQVFGEQGPFSELGPDMGARSTRVQTKLGAHERAIMNGIAAFQLRYGASEEALAILQLCNRLWPEDQQTLRLLTQAFIQIEDWASADMTETALRRLSAPGTMERLDHLRRAIIHFGCLRLAEARASFLDFVRLGKGAF